MEKSKTYYWAIFSGKESVFEGSFTQCWERFIEMYGARTVKSLAASDIRIARKS